MSIVIMYVIFNLHVLVSTCCTHLLIYMHNNESMGILTYADNISLLCPTLFGIQKKCYI